jgi:hypothetical protein
MGGFLDRVSGLLDKGLILAAVFPLLIIGSIVTLSGVAIVGWRASLFWFASLSTASIAVLTAALTIGLLLAAFLLRSLRRVILNVWSGGGAAGWQIRPEEWRRARLERDANALPIWQGSQVRISQIVAQPRGNVMPQAQLQSLTFRINALINPRRAVPETAQRNQFNQVAEDLRVAAETFDGTALIPLRVRLQRFVRRLEKEETIRRQTLGHRLDMEFGPEDITTATRLGNLLTAIDTYPVRRYHLEGGMFWPHLEQMMKGDLREEIQNQRILLDFLLALATLSGLLAVIILIIGPWLWPGYMLYLVAGVIAGISFFFYKCSIPTAMAMGRGLRAGCDLYRRELLSALGVNLPNTLEEERILWARLSRLAIYSETRDLRFYRRPEPRDDK